MIAKKQLASTLLTVVALSWMGASVASAQDARIGVANPVRIFNEMQEVKDLKQKLEGERARIEQETKTRRERIQALQGARDQLRPDSPQFSERDRELQQAAIEFDVWTRITQAAAQRQQKMQMVTTYEKIEAATAEVAKQKGLTVVFADQRQDLPDNVDPIPVEQLRGILGARNVMYAADTADISNEVIALLDTKYKSGQ
jgi:Skp family chaperone for outer membrane proteins